MPQLPSSHPSSPPLIICGAPGSGTSLLARMLRQCGVFMGADAGPLDQRKYHESEWFSRINRDWLEQLIGFPHAPKSVQQFQQVASAPPERADQLAWSVDLEELLGQFWGDHDRTGPWGWKDPRNSATAFIWRRLFPTARIVILKRTWSWRDFLKRTGSDSGMWFRHQSTRAIRRCYLHPPGIDLNERIVVDFDRLIRDESEINRVLEQLDLGLLKVNDFEAFRHRCSVEH